MSERIEINFSDSRDDGLRKLANLLDPILLEEFRKRLTDMSEKRSLQELVSDLLEGR